MREVPAKLFGFMRECARRQGLDVEAAQRGLSLADVDVDGAGERVDWDELAEFINRSFGTLDVEEQERAGEDYVQVHLWVQVLARVLTTPRILHRFICEESKPAFPHMRMIVEPHEDHLRWEMWLPEAYRPSEAFFRATIGEIRATNALLGRSPARVVADVGPRHGIYEIYYGEPPAKLDRAVERGQEVVDRATREVLRMLGWALRSDRRASSPLGVLALQRQHGLTLSEARVASRLASGMSVAEIARQLGVSTATIRSHLKAAYAKTGTRGQAELVRLVLTGQSGR